MKKILVFFFITFMNISIVAMDPLKKGHPAWIKIFHQLGCSFLISELGKVTNIKNVKTVTISQMREILKKSKEKPSYLETSLTYLDVLAGSGRCILEGQEYIFYDNTSNEQVKIISKSRGKSS